MYIIKNKIYLKKKEELSNKANSGHLLLQFLSEETEAITTFLWVAWRLCKVNDLLKVTKLVCRRAWFQVMGLLKSLFILLWGPSEEQTPLLLRTFSGS